MTRARRDPGKGSESSRPGVFMIRISEIDKEDAGRLCHAFLGTAWERPLN